MYQVHSKIRYQDHSTIKNPISGPKLGFPYILISVIRTISLIRPLLDSPKGGLNITVLIYV